jgi:hypothetical protein
MKHLWQDNTGSCVAPFYIQLKRVRQKDHEFKASLGYAVRSYLITKNNNRNKQIIYTYSLKETKQIWKSPKVPKFLLSIYYNTEDRANNKTLIVSIK